MVGSQRRSEYTVFGNAINLRWARTVFDIHGGCNAADGHGKPAPPGPSITFLVQRIRLIHCLLLQRPADGPGAGPAL